MRRISLVAMKSGQRGAIVEIAGGGLLQSRLEDLGLVPGREVLKVSHFALRGPITIRLARTTLAIGHGTAAKVFVSIHDEKNIPGRQSQRR